MAVGRSLLSVSRSHLQRQRSAWWLSIWILQRGAWKTLGRWFLGRWERGVSAQWACAWPFQALEKKGISHLEEKELKERNKRIQEDNRLELQKVGWPLAACVGSGGLPL